MDINQFVNELVKYIKDENIFGLVLEQMEKENVSWDEAVATRERTTHSQFLSR